MRLYVRRRIPDVQKSLLAVVDALVVQAAAAGTGWEYAGLDPTPAPGGSDSIGAAIESFTGVPFGALLG